MTLNPYENFVASFARLTREGKQLPLGNIPKSSRPRPAPDAPAVLIFSPHPDDECIIGGLALRLQREAGYRAINIAVTQGSKPERQTERLAELRAACHYLDFDLEQTAPNGLEGIHAKTRADAPEQWSVAVTVIAKILACHQPQAILFPHELDWNSCHIGTHHLVMDALHTLPTTFSTFLVETEYWAPMSNPNVMVELSETDLADMLAALSFHVGEVTRNPYHVSVAAWMMDNVRRAELVGGQGTAAPDFRFATLYRLRRWSRGMPHDVRLTERFLGCHSLPTRLFSV